MRLQIFENLKYEYNLKVKYFETFDYFSFFQEILKVIKNLFLSPKVSFSRTQTPTFKIHPQVL